MSLARFVFHLVSPAAFLCLAYLVPAQALTREEMTQELMGAPVYTSDGHEVGTVVDVAMGGDGDVDAVRIKTGAVLGFGERVVTLSRGDFIVLRGTVVLDLPAEAIENLRPEVSDDASQDRE